MSYREFTQVHTLLTRDHGLTASYWTLRRYATADRAQLTHVENRLNGRTRKTLGTCG